MLSVLWYCILGLTSLFAEESDRRSGSPKRLLLALAFSDKEGPSLASGTYIRVIVGPIFIAIVGFLFRFLMLQFLNVSLLILQSLNVSVLMLQSLDVPVLMLQY